jgi:two-component system LytT family response regulator
MIRCFIVDNEPAGRAQIAMKLERHAGVVVTLSHGDSAEALASVLADPPDLIFLEVDMPGTDGFAFIARMRAKLAPRPYPPVILTANVERYALHAFEYGALDYLVKPIDDQRFDLALERARERIQLRLLAAANAEPETAADDTRLHFKMPGGELFLKPQDICWVETAGHYLHVYLQSGHHLVRQTMAEMARLLEPHGFMRVHRRVLVNPSQVRLTQSLAEGGMLFLQEGSSIRVSRRRWSEIRDALQAAWGNVEA